MSLFDSLLGQLGSNVDVGSIAQKFGVDPETAQTAIAAWGRLIRSRAIRWKPPPPTPVSIPPC
jgi:hypothetical protein